MICDGVIFGPLGRVTSTFNADFDISWEGNVCTIKEHFRYDDGTTQDRCWRIELDGGGGFEATADDVPTLNAFDCMYLTKNGTIVNRSQFRKFGFRVAELVATIRKKETV